MAYYPSVIALLPSAHRCLCGATIGVRLFICGYRCPAHTPAAMAGRPEPDEYKSPSLQARDTPPQPSDAHLWPADETGYCARCRQPCHRYGTGGNPLCTGCRVDSATTTS